MLEARGLRVAYGDAIAVWDASLRVGAGEVYALRTPHILQKPYKTIFGEFEGRHAATNAESETGDVKYHLGFTTARKNLRGHVRR